MKKIDMFLLLVAGADFGWAFDYAIDGQGLDAIIFAVAGAFCLVPFLLHRKG